MIKYLKNYDKTIEEYKKYVCSITSKGKNAFYKREKEYFEKLIILINKINQIFPNTLVTDEVMKSLDEMFTLKEIVHPSFNETLRKVYPFLKAYPELSTNFVKELLPFYNARMFEDLNLFKELDKAIESKDDKYFEDIITKAVLGKLNYDKKWDNDAYILNLYKDRYSCSFIEYLKAKAKERYIDYSSILLSIPSEELVSNDEKLVASINHIYKTNNIPFSYDITIMNAEVEDLSMYNNDLYYDTLEGRVKALFTIEDYKKDIRREKQYTK